MYSDNTDYTGFLVRTRKPVAVYGGCDCIEIPDNTNHCDHIMEQVRVASFDVCRVQLPDLVQFVGESSLSSTVQ